MSSRWLGSRSAHRRSVRPSSPCPLACAHRAAVAGVVTQISSNLLSSPVSGLMGLGFQTIASSGATPFWEALANSDGTLDEPLMAFQLTRFVNDSNAQQLEPGGTFNLGSTNSSLFTGNIDYQDIPSGQEGYWIQELSGTL